MESFGDALDRLTQDFVAELLATVRAAGASPARKTAPSPQPKVVKFEVVPHPEQKNRRIVLTRLDNA